MNKMVFAVAGMAAGFCLGWMILSQRSSAELQQQRAAWEVEKATLQARLDELANQPQPEPGIVEKTKIVRVSSKESPKEIIAKLEKLRISSGAGQTKHARTAIQYFETLIAAGPSALPAIRDFLMGNVDVDYDSSLSPRASRDGRISTEFALPPSLRFGLMDVTRQIGGDEAEQLLAEVLGITGRGAEIAYIARVLQDMAPDKYRERCLTIVRELLSNPVATNNSGLDKYDREYLFGVLALFGDNSFAAEAQTRLVREDGFIDRGALKYLQNTVGPQAMAAIARAYQDSAIDPAKKEPLARYALTFAGADIQATEFLHSAFKDPQLPLPQRAELIEDLNQDGIQSEDNPTARDAVLIRARLELIDRWYSEADNKALVDAFNEARKDLLNMLKKYNSTTGVAAQ